MRGKEGEELGKELDRGRREQNGVMERTGKKKIEEGNGDIGQRRVEGNHRGIRERKGKNMEDKEKVESWEGRVS